VRSGDGPAGQAAGRSRHDLRARSADRRHPPLPDRLEGLPDLPTGYARALDAGLTTLGLTLADDARAAIDGHVRLLLGWTEAINLTSIRSPAEVARLHVLDSLIGITFLRDLGSPPLLDLGSGGGFPGLPLAAVLRPARACLVDATAKKARFLETVVRAVGLAGRVEAIAARAEALAAGPDRERWPVVTARAVGSLAELAELAFPLLQPGGRLIAWKRGDLTVERAALGRAVRALGSGDVEVEIAAPEALDLPGHRLVVVRKGGRTDGLYPRDPGLRRRRPW
jgi:16S rRNA (guanine527-N7)-methyltransferase